MTRKILRPDMPRWHHAFLSRETLSFNLMYVVACYPVGTTISKTSSLFTALLQHYKGYVIHAELIFSVCINVHEVHVRISS